MAARPGFDSRKEKEFFVCPPQPDRAWGPVSYAMGAGGAFLGGKAAEAAAWPLSYYCWG
jgi:hypothetical protein